MRRVALKLRKFLVDEDGPTSTEYAVMLGLVIVVALVTIATSGEHLSATFGDVGDSVATDGGDVGDAGDAGNDGGGGWFRGGGRLQTFGGQLARTRL